MKNILLLLAFIISIQMNAQVKISGTVIESNGSQPIPYATVVIKSKFSEINLGGATTDINGKFTLSTDSTDFNIEVSFIGFEKKLITDFQIQNNKLNLGEIKLSENTNSLDEMVVRAEKSQTEFKLDKRVFNVGKDLSSTGASAMEVLDNVPSVNVNIDGQISLRGSAGVQILIDGKPSVLASEQGNALGTITADMIEKVEVITNPSAKYDAEGTSGIINIVLKKEEKKGMNGSISFNTGIPHNHSIGVSLNRRTEKFNLFSQLGAGYRSMPTYNKNINQDLTQNTSILSEGTEYRNEQFYNFNLGTDYHMNDFNVITLSGNVAYEIENQPSETYFQYQDSTGEISSMWNRTEITEALNPKFQFELNYKKDFKNNKDHDLIFSALGNFFGKDQSSEFHNVTTFGTDNDLDQRTATNFKESKYTFKLDYTNPITKKIGLETGAQYVLQDVSNDYEVSNLSNNVWVADPGLTNQFDYIQNVFGVYGTGSFEHKKAGVKIGLRAENTDLRTVLINTNESNNRNYTNLFPSVHTSYKLTDRLSFQAGYSKRIYRPRLWDLNPFFNIRNNYSIRTGNPDLLPEFTDSYELNGIYILDKLSLNLGVYQRNTTDVIDQISTFENNVNTYMPMNIGKRNSTGVELNSKYSITKKITFLGDFNYNYFVRTGQFEGTNFDFSADQWTAKATFKFNFPHDIDFETTGRYESSYRTVQGVTSDIFFTNLGLRKKIMKGKTIVSVGVRDLFISRIRETETIQQDFYIYSRGYRGRFITFGLSYGFGKGEAMEFSGRRHH